ncbi:cell division protein FtsA [Spartobacteria bacterium LR76]|uniref:Cell division protein FtsA n=1 Tax=Terrimicrobium sacchariphilum TaxID=690879 RepID=A0A146GCS0_TERSA|nr:cell division protein FtsA [Terrimicrobium sacchariphilum]PTX95370.1 cell division protein FtsA [Spartobacteria bacterium LR76]GAT34316.1 cell division protein FtsA [Terrimicrobium sacchariphilum]
MARSDILVGVEVGTSKVCAVVGETGREGTLRILGVGSAPSRGVRKGEIVDIAIATECVHDALADAETNSDAEIGSVSVAVTGSHIRSFNSRGAILIPSERFEIDEEDVSEVAVKAREVNIPTENAFLHSIIQHYYVDGQDGVLNPIGMVGRRLEADYHIIHGVKTRLQNTLRCIRENGVQLDEVVVNSLASAQAVLDQHQKDLGAVVIDMGGGVTDYIVYENGAVRHSGVLAVGGDHISNDISLGLRIPLTRAEKLKVEEGSTVLGQGTPGEMIVLKNDAGFSGKEVEREMLNTIIHARVREMFELIRKGIESEIPLHLLGAGVVLTGGCSLIKGIKDVAESVFDLPVSLAREAGVSGPKSVLNNPQYSTAIGLIKFTQALRAEEEDPGLFGSVLQKIGGIFRRKG